MTIIYHECNHCDCSQYHGVPILCDEVGEVLNAVFREENIVEGEERTERVDLSKRLQLDSKNYQSRGIEAPLYTS